MAIETQASLVRSIIIPDELQNGRYSFQARVLYGEGQEQLASTNFVVEKPFNLYKELIPVGIGLLILLALLFILYKSKDSIERKLSLWRMKKKIKKIVMKRVMSPLPKTQDTSSAQK